MYERIHLDLFSGIGGFALAAQWAGYRTIAFCERDKFCQAVLRKHWPGVPCHDDITKLDGTQFRGVNLLTGGFPCQPFSCAGKRRGKEDDRYLWPSMLRVIKEARPDWVLGENVAGLDGLGLDACIFDLESIGYEVGPPLEIPACAIGADHLRNRLWIFANAIGERFKGIRLEGCREESTGNFNARERGEVFIRHEVLRQTPALLLQDWESSLEPIFLQPAHGISSWTHEIKSLGNAIVPQVAYQIIKAITEVTP